MGLDTKGISRKALLGLDPNYKQVHDLYIAVFIHTFMSQLYTSFMIRSRGGSDDLGNSWKRLSPRTHAYKPLTTIDRQNHSLEDDTFRGLLNSTQDRVWRAIFARNYNALLDSGMDKEQAAHVAASKAWGVLKSKYEARTLISLNRNTPINIRTGRLVNTIRPGQIQANNYVPPPGQRVTYIPGKKLSVKFDVPYIDEVDKVRPIIPENIQPWIETAHTKAINTVKPIYERICSSRKRR